MLKNLKYKRNEGFQKSLSEDNGASSVILLKSLAMQKCPA